MKLFGIDGGVDMNWWLGLVGFFYQGNQMVLEYFDTEEYERRFGEQDREFRESYSSPHSDTGYPGYLE